VKQARGGECLVHFVLPPVGCNLLRLICEAAAARLEEQKSLPIYSIPRGRERGTQTYDLVGWHLRDHF
jgi:hypothetical protein